ncbi:MAG: glutaredoxin family protein [Candidatus Nanoarchaeia archaeon]
MVEKKVRMYTTPSCTWCKRTKDFFKDNNVKFEEVDVSSDHKAAHEMVHKSGQMGVPVTDINGSIVIGFNETKLKTLLEIK